jgi:hypothetical protein
MLFINFEQNAEETNTYSFINVGNMFMFSLYIFHSAVDNCRLIILIRKLCKSH